MDKRLRLVVACAALLAPVVAVADSDLGVEPPDVKAPFASWTPVQQWMPHDRGSDPRFAYGYGSLAGALLLADELADKLSELGRASLVDRCFGENNYRADASSTLIWALCGPDAKAL